MPAFAAFRFLRFAALVAVGAAAGYALYRTFKQKEGGLLEGEPPIPKARAGSFLCDSCRFNSPRYCSWPDFPNATECPDYKSKSI